MRTIKFRAWDKEYEKMTYFDDEDYEYNPPLVFRLDQVFKKNSNYDDYEDFEYNDITDKVEVMQYTGLHDKNGKGIYEGDIIFIKGETKLLDIKGKVEYSNILAQFIITNTGSIVNEAEPLGDYEEEDIEVIGNIYDNKELLNETNR